MFHLPFAESDHPKPRPETVHDKPRAKTGKGPEADKGAAVDQADARQRPAGGEGRSMLGTLLPWGISFLFHAGLVLIAFFTIWIVLNEKQEQKTVIPSVNLSRSPPRPLTMEQIETVRPSSSSRSISSQSMPSQPNSLQTRVNMQTPLIGVQGQTGGQPSPFGSTIGSQARFKAQFMGSTGNARSIVFVVDASGSLLDMFPFVMLELQKTIRRLSSKQTFTVLFFQGDNHVVELAAPRKGMKAATSQTKQAAVDWLDPDSHNIDPHGRTNPIPAIKRALGYQPELMYLLSDNITGGGTGATRYELEQHRLLAQVRDANQTDTKINTIQFLYQDPLVKAGRKPTLKLIAQQSGGVYKFVDNAQLNVGIRGPGSGIR